MKKNAPGHVVNAAASASSTSLFAALAILALRASTSVKVGSASIRPTAPNPSHESARSVESDCESRSKRRDHVAESLACTREVQRLGRSVDVVAGQGDEEWASADAHHRAGCERSHRGSGRDAREQRHLADHVPTRRAPQASAFRAHLELAVGDHVTGIAEFAFHHDRLPGVDANGVSRPRHLFERHRGEGREHRQPGQQRHLHHRHLGVRVGTAQ